MKNLNDHRLRLEITDDYTKAAAIHINKGDLSNYTTDGTFIYQIISHDEYVRRVNNGDNEPFKMEELGLECEYDYNYKRKLEWED